MRWWVIELLAAIGMGFFVWAVIEVAAAARISAGLVG